MLLVTSGLLMAVSTTDPHELCTDSTTQKPKSKNPALSEGDYTNHSPHDMEHHHNNYKAHGTRTDNPAQW